ncbi:putative Mannose-6-phosphate isomerase [Rhodotorula taiwanensis]|uniref:Mannose-6-phosphate isomerase n=1 Tax=Rhodotorula taiwanensis TaxID=741276 RepID=A0A2S5B3U3_9BASI|nr:putative Mannose-6-phosphate isomerase [Rhodotorula taiwanensis]
MSTQSGPDRPALVQLKPYLQPFPYGRNGKESWAAQYALETPSLKAEVDKNGGIKADQPYGEIWLGSTHENGPCFVEGKEQSLKELIQTNPEYYLGPKLLADQQMSSQYKNNLPYLFKVLSFDKPLPLQCHPDKKLGGKLMEDEKRRKGQNEDFVDSNAKPEVGIALSPFTAFVGFRPVEQVAAVLRGTPELQELFNPDTLEAYYRVAESSPNEADGKAALRTLFAEAVNASSSKVKAIVPKLCKRIAQEGADQVFGAANAYTAKGEANASGESEAEAMARAFEISVKTYGDEDVGSLTALTLMNVLRMRAGEGTWIQADDLHAYVEGSIIECMANSDNMVAHGLGTEEQGGISTFVDMLTYRHLPADQLLVPYQDAWNKGQEGLTRLYNVPIAEFDLIRVSLPPSREEKVSALDGPLCLVVTAGAVEVTVDGESLTVSRGQAAFVRAGADIAFSNAGAKEVEIWGAFYQ